MKLSDFFISSRQLFGFISPGAVWVFAWMLGSGINPLTYLGGDDWVPHFLLFLGLSYIVGFLVQTLSFMLIRKFWDDPRPEQHVEEIGRLLDEQLCVKIHPERLPWFCRNLALEYSSYARYRIVELESEINFMVALACSLPALPISWILYAGGSPSRWLLSVLAAVGSVTLLFRRIPDIRKNEREMWCEKYVILQARSNWVTDAPAAVENQSQ